MSSITDLLNPVPGRPGEFVPPLENGDHLDTDEFFRRYEAMPEGIKCELINGIVYMQAAVRASSHGEPHSQMVTWLGTYEAFTPGVKVGDNTITRLAPRQAPQPDVYLRILEDCGGRSRIVDDYLVEAPELIVEVSGSSVSYDTHEKFELYEQQGALEYIIWRVLDRELDWFARQQGKL